MGFVPGEKQPLDIGARGPIEAVFIRRSEMRMADLKNVDADSRQVQAFPTPQPAALVRLPAGNQELVLLSKLTRPT